MYDPRWDDPRDRDDGRGACTTRVTEPRTTRATD